MERNSRNKNEPVDHILSAGWLIDVLRKLSLPVVAWPGQSIFRVLLHGYGFVLPVENSEPSIGFYTTYFVAARSIRDAQAKAVERLYERWSVYYREASGDLYVEVEDLERINVRFVARSRYGMGFYRAD